MRCLVGLSGLLLLLLGACVESPGLPGAPCVEDRDCEGAGVCGPDGACSVPEDPRIPVAGGGVLRQTDAGPGEAEPSPDAGNGHLDAGLPDQGDPDLGGSDAGSGDLGGADAGSADLGPSDAGSADAGAVDLGPGGGAQDGGAPVAAGTYAFRRLLVSGIPTGQGLWRVALSSDDRTLVASDHGPRLFVVDRGTETLLETIDLPAPGADAVRIGDVAFAPGRDWLLVAATAYDGDRVTGHIYRVEPRSAQVASVGSSPGFALERVVFRRGTDVADVLGHEHLGGGRYGLGLFVYDDAARTFDLDQIEPTQAGCEGLARAADGLGGMARIYTCGIGGGDVGHVDATGTVYPGPGMGNVSHVDAHPSGAYALAVGWAGARLVRFENGRWTSGSQAPNLVSPRLSKLEFSSDGTRALIVGGYERSTGRLELREYRDGAYATIGLRDVSIRGFDAAPWLGVNGSGLFDAVWRPGCDEGYLVGGCGGRPCSRGWLVHFRVTNGRACPAP